MDDSHCPRDDRPMPEVTLIGGTQRRLTHQVQAKTYISRDNPLAAGTGSSSVAQVAKMMKAPPPSRRVNPTAWHCWR
eukprot:1873767-Amphidinium_carterae.1